MARYRLTRPRRQLAPGDRVLQAAQRRRTSNVPTADRGRVGVCLPRRQHGGVLWITKARKPRVVPREQWRPIHRGAQKWADSLGPV